jgi:histidinol-phosphate aminotransferase
VASLPSYVPGRPSALGTAEFKLSSNENPFPPLPAILDAVASAAEAMNRYPDMGCTDLYSALGERLGVPTTRLAAGTGSVAVLYHLLQAFCEPGDEVVYAWRSFEAYPIAVAVTGATSVHVPLDAEACHDLDAMADAVTERTRVVIVCTPNNPTGPAVGRSALEAFLDKLPPRVLVVVDEAYGEFVRGEDRLDALAVAGDRPNVAVLRTFAKAYGLAGLRVGYAVAPEPVAAAVRSCALPFGVSSVAQAAALAALRHEAELLERVDLIVTERERVAGLLRGQGWSVPDAQGNFVWLPAGTRTADLSTALGEQGLTVRPFSGEGIRVSIGTREASDVLLRVTAAFRPSPDAA